MSMLVPTRLLAFATLLTVVLALAGCAGKDPVARGSVEAFGSTLEITLIGVNREQASEVTEVLSEDLRTMEQSWHAWHPGPIARVNLQFNIDDRPFAAPPSVLPILKLSKTLSQQSEGLFNPAIGHLYRAWGFQGRPAECLEEPDPAVIEAVVDNRPSMDDVHIDGFRIWSTNDTVKLDFRGIQRGFAIDQAVARLEELGINNASVAIDGNVRAIGSRDGHPWSVPIRGPEGAGLLATLQIKGNEAAFTAAIRNHSYHGKGKTFHDLIDPRTGYPAEGATSVTVLHPNASTADAAANALFVAGPNDWHRIARLLGVRYVMMTDRRGRLHMNPAMQARIKLHTLNREVVISEPLT
jgi:thiamine biosynthesis lipoprotein